MDQIWSWVLSAIGIVGFYFAGRKIWWAWYINIANQVIWTVYAIVTEQWGFLVATAFYFAVFIKNARDWTRDHFLLKRNNGLIGEVHDVWQDEDGLHVRGRVSTKFGDRLLEEAEKQDRGLNYFRPDDIAQVKKERDV